MKFVTAFSLALAIVAGPSANAGAPSPTERYTTLLKAVPVTASFVLAIDHQAIRSHTHHERLFKFLNSQGYARQFAALSRAGWNIRDKLEHTVSYRIGRAQAVVVFRHKGDTSRLRSHGEEALGDRFKAGKAWFLLTPDLAVGAPGEGLVMIGPLASIKAGLAALSGGKTIVRRPRFPALRKEASAGGAVVWSVTYVPPEARKRLRDRGAADMAHIQTSTLRITGSSALRLRIIGHTADSKGADAVARALNGKIQRKIHNNRLINALVGHLVRQLTITPQRKRVVGAMTLTSEQVAVVAKYGARVITLLR